MTWTVDEWAQRIASGDERALARALTAVENRAPEARRLLSLLFARTGGSLVIGVTGPPGAGKSTLVDQLARVAREQHQTVGILAVDPSSPFTGGAILGDRVRMMRHFADPGVFVRSMATRGTLGGLAAAATDAVVLLAAAGRQLVLVETVGVGQDEVEVARLAGVTIVVLVPGMGDDVQAIKAGIMEVADIFVVNKADRPGAGQLVSELRAMLSISGRDAASLPPILETVASGGAGVPEVLETARELGGRLNRPERRKALWGERLREMLRERLLERLDPGALNAAAGRVVAGTQDPYQAADELIARILERVD